MSAPSRHRWGLCAGAASIVTLSLLVTLVWIPQAAERDALMLQISQRKALLEWLTTQPVQAAIDSNRERISRGTLTILSAVHASLAERPLASQVTGIQSTSEQAVTVMLDAARFDQVVHWIDRLGREFGADVSTITLQRGAEPGVVSGEVTVMRTSP